MDLQNLPEDVYDIAIIGGGPAGLTAGMYAARARMKTLMVESLSIMGQITMTDTIENYPGIKSSGGFDLVTSMKDQAVSFGLECVTGTVEKMSASREDGVQLWALRHDGGVIKSLSIIIASGARPKKLRAPGEEELCGRGVSYCATCDAAFFRDKDVVVVGGGNTAVEEALFLTKFGKKVTLVHRRDRLRATKVLQERAFSNKKMSVIWNSVIESIDGKMKVEGVSLKNVKTGESSKMTCDGVFIFAGWTPNTSFINEDIPAADSGKIIVDDAMNTGVEGVFAAGDCCQRPMQQVITACGDGAVASQSAQNYVEELKGVAYK